MMEELNEKIIYRKNKIAEVIPFLSIIVECKQSKLFNQKVEIGIIELC